MTTKFDCEEFGLKLGIENRHVLVTGASQGIGRAVARAFSENGCRVSGIARQTNKLESLIDELRTGDHGFLAQDLIKTGSPTTAVDQIIADRGEIDIVVHAVGGSLGLNDPFLAVHEWERIWRLNVGIGIEINNRLLPTMAERNWGRAVHISSRAAVEYGGAPAYNSAKAYLNAYVTSMGRHLCAKNVLVTAIMPSAVAAEGNGWDRATQNDPDKVKAFVERHQSIGRLGNAADLVPFIMLLASQANTFAAGSVISVDGGSM